jgi:hypothetical protein
MIKALDFVTMIFDEGSGQTRLGDMIVASRFEDGAKFGMSKLKLAASLYLCIPTGTATGTDHSL